MAVTEAKKKYQREYFRRRRATDPEFVARMRAYRMKRYYEDIEVSRARGLVSAKKYYKNHRAKVEQRRRERAAANLPNHWTVTVLASAKQRARKKGLVFEITKQWLQQKIADGVCEVSGVSFEFRLGGRTSRSPSIDRIDAAKGYVEENCRVVLWALNAAFSEWGEDETLELFRAVLRKRGEL